MIKLSFVVPAYNEENYIGPCLEAILREIRGRNDAEVIVVDNNSNDHTAEIVARHPGVKLVRESQKGANRTRQTGFAASQGAYVAFIDADTIMPQGWVARAEKEFAKDKDIVCVNGPFIYYDLPLGIRILVRTFYILAYVIYLISRALFQKTTFIQGGNYIVRRDALEKIGGLNAGIIFYGDDTDLAMRLNKTGKVKFTFKLPILTSGRRLAKEGTFTMGFRYALNNFWMIFFQRPFTMASKEIRFGKEGTVYAPENRWKERFIAVAFTTMVLVFFGALVFIAYLILHAGVFGTIDLVQLSTQAKNVLQEVK